MNNEHSINLIPTTQQSISQNPVTPPTNPIEPDKTKLNKSHSMWDAFEHTIMFISLYVTAISLALLLHYFVDLKFPSFSSSGYNYTTESYFRDTILRGYYSALIVASPIFTILFLQIRRKTILRPELRNLESRKKLIYITLVITFIIMIANLISIIYNFLGGNVTLNFALHFLTTTSISGIIFAYYLNEVKQDRKLTT